MIRIRLSHFPLWMLRCSMLAVIGFILYGGFYPFRPFVAPTQGIWEILYFNAVHKVFLFDIVQNLLFFLPLGFIAALYSVAVHDRIRWSLILLLGLCLSTFVEMTQSYLPMRVPSLLDIVLNAISTGFGIWVYLGMTLGTGALPTGQQLKLGALLLCWLLSQVAPWLPSLHPLQLQYSLHHTEAYTQTILSGWLDLLSYSLQGLLLIWLCDCLSKKHAQKMMAFLLLLFFVGQLITVGHQLEAAPLIGLLIAALLSQFKKIAWILSVTALRLILGMSIAFMSLIVTPWQTAISLEDPGYIVYLQCIFWGGWLLLGTFSEKQLDNSTIT